MGSGDSDRRFRPAIGYRAAAGLAAVLVTASAALALGAPDGAGGAASGRRGVAADREQAPTVDLVSRVDARRALTDVLRLSGEMPICPEPSCATIHNRLTGSTGTALALEYVAAQTAGLPFSVDEHPWTALPWLDRNLVLRRTGIVSPTEEIVILAHVDGVATCPDGRCPAADDNASGVAALLELARALGDVPTARSLTLLFSTGEEQNVLGVTAYIATLSPSDLARITAVINLDMVGWDGDGDRVMELYHGGHEPSLQLAAGMKAAIEAAGLDLVPRLNPGCG